LRILLTTLCITPLRKLTGWNNVIKYRRMLGLFAFFYGFLHFLTYAWLDQFFSVSDMLRDVYKRPFISAGFTGFIVMAPLAITSTTKWIVRLGGRRWQLLHRLTYVAGIAGVVHYLWLVKSDIERPVLYGALLFIPAWFPSGWFNLPLYGILDQGFRQATTVSQYFLYKLISQARTITDHLGRITGIAESRCT
jgi:sulfoxide reductase heme-binding subunit YedZ